MTFPTELITPAGRHIPCEVKVDLYGTSATWSAQFLMPRTGRVHLVAHGFVEHVDQVSVNAKVSAAFAAAMHNQEVADLCTLYDRMYEKPE